MKKGFTLIELLAVIVILAIIAVIAVPIVLNIINDTKESAVLRSAEFYLDGVETSIATSILKGISISDGTYSIMQDGNLCIGTLNNNTCTGDILKVEMDGEVPKEGIITIKDGQINKVELTLSEKEVWIDPFTNELAYKLAPGLYDENDNLLISWDDLTSMDYKTITYYYHEWNDETGEDDVEEFYSAILNVDENGVLTSAYHEADWFNYSAEYLAGKLVLDESVKSIDYSTFRWCENLTSIIIPNSVTYIDTYAFYGCSNLTTVTIPNSVIVIDEFTFANCSSLTTVIIEEGVTRIRWNAFGNCESLTSITIPNSVTFIEEDAFSNCPSLTTLYYKGTATGAPWGAPKATLVTNF